MFSPRVFVFLFFVSQLVCGEKSIFSFGDYIRKELTNKRNIPLVVALLGVLYLYRSKVSSNNAFENLYGKVNTKLLDSRRAERKVDLEITHLNKELEKRSSETDSLKELCNKMIRENDILISDKEKLTEENSAISRKKEELHHENRRLPELVQSAERRLNESQSTIKLLHSFIAQLNDKVCKLTKENDVVSKKSKSLQVENDRLVQLNESQYEKDNKNKNEITLLKLKLDEINKERLTLQSKITRLEQENKVLQTTKDTTLMQNYNDQSNQLIELRNSSENLNAKIIHLEAELSRCTCDLQKNVSREQYQKVIDHCDQLRKELYECNTKLSSLERQVQEECSKNEILLSDRDKLSQELQSLRELQKQSEQCNTFSELEKLQNDMKECLLERQTTVNELEIVINNQKEVLTTLVTFISGLQDVFQKLRNNLSRCDDVDVEKCDSFKEFNRDYKNIARILYASTNDYRIEEFNVIFDRTKKSVQLIANFFFEFTHKDLNLQQMQQEMEKLKEDMGEKDKEISKLHKQHDEAVEVLKKKQVSRLKQISGELDKIVKKGDPEKQVSEETIMKTIESLKLLLQKYEIISVEMSKMRDETDNLQKKNHDLQKRCYEYQSQKKDKDNDRRFKDEFEHAIACITIERDGILHAKNEQLKTFKGIIDWFHYEVKTMQKCYQERLKQLQDNAAKIVLQKEHQFSERVSELERYKNELSEKFGQSENELRMNYEKKANELSRQYDNAIEEVKLSWQMQPVLVFHDATLKKQIMHNPYIGLF